MAGKKPPIDRRTVLKYAGSGALLTGIGVGNAGAANNELEEFKNNVEQSYRVRKEHGKTAQQKFLTEHGYSTVFKDPIHFQIEMDDDELKNENDVHPERIEDPDDGGIEIAMNGVYNPNNERYTVTMDIGYNFAWRCSGGRQRLDSWGTNPRDGVGFSYASLQDRYFNLATTDTSEAMLTGQYTDYEGDFDGPEGRVGFRSSDKGVWSDWKDTDICPNGSQSGTAWGAWCGLLLEANGNFDPDDRRVWGRYTNAWYNYSISTGLSLSGSGNVFSLAVTPERRVGQVELSEDENGNILVISEEEMIQ